MNAERLRSLTDYLIRYALGSGGAVLADFLIFVALIRCFAVEPGWANVASTVIGFALAWVISGKTLFRKYRIPLRGYGLWFGYQAVVIPVYSWLLHMVVTAGLHEYAAKVLCIGVSFVINSVFFKLCVLNCRKESR